MLSPVYEKRETPHGHPECPQRVEAIRTALERASLLERCELISPECAAEDDLLLVHEAHYLRRFLRAVQEGDDHLDSLDCPLSPETEEVARLAVGGVIGAVKNVLEGAVRNAFCCVRPPGHHAERDRAMGFCFLNNVAIAARYAQRHYGIKRVFILDWDVHHGNGTQNTFFHDPTVFYASLHGHPATLYPGTGFREEQGSGPGQGTTLNIPMMPRSATAEYRRAFDEEVIPAIRDFSPDLVFISAGFDAHRDDPLGNQALRSEDFGWMTEEVLRVAEEFCAGRVVSVLEGGYNLAALGESVRIHLEALCNGGR